MRREGKTEFALTEELVLHYASLIFGKDAVQEKCLFRVTRNADIDVKEGMMENLANTLGAANAFMFIVLLVSIVSD